MIGDVRTSHLYTDIFIRVFPVIGESADRYFCEMKDAKLSKSMCSRSITEQKRENKPDYFHDSELADWFVICPVSNQAVNQQGAGECERG